MKCLEVRLPSNLAHDLQCNPGGRCFGRWQVLWPISSIGQPAALEKKAKVQHAQMLGGLRGKLFWLGSIDVEMVY